jgi:hypothetical protein
LISIRPLQIEDIAEIADSARRADVEEMLACTGASVCAALSYGLQHSLRSWVIEDDGTPLAAVGDTLAAIGVGVPWMVTTNHITINPRGFLRASKAVLREAMQRHSKLINYVDARNADAVRWLAWLGFTIGPAVPYGASRLPFHEFTLIRSD